MSHRKVTRAQSFKTTVVFGILIDAFCWLTLCLYVSGGFSIHGNIVGGFIQDALRVCAVLGLVGLFLKMDLTELSIVKAVLEVNDSLLVRRLPKTFGGRAMAAAWLYLVGLFLLAPLVRHWGYGTWRWDLGAIEQIIWRGAHGLGFTSTIIQNSADHPLDFFRQNHLSLYLIPLSWIYSLFPYTETLVFIQSLALLGCLFPLWGIGRMVLPKGFPPVLLIVFFWFCENVHRVNIWDMHENAYIAFVFLMSVYFFLQKRWTWATVFCIFVGCFKEDAWVLAGALGSYCLWDRKRFWMAPIPLVLGFLLFIGYGAFFSTGALALNERYAYLGKDFTEAKGIILGEPWVFLKQLVVVDNLKFYLKVLLMGGGLWLFSGRALILLMPTVFEIALSTYDPMRSFNNHYIIPMVGPLLFAVALGILNLSVRLKNGLTLQRLVAAAVLLSVSQLKYSEANTVKTILNHSSWKNRNCLNALVKIVPDSVPVYANDPFSTRMSRREILLAYVPGIEIPYPNAWALYPSQDPTPEGFELVKDDCGFKAAKVKGS